MLTCLHCTGWLSTLTPHPSCQHINVLSYNPNKHIHHEYSSVSILNNSFQTHIYTETEAHKYKHTCTHTLSTLSTQALPLSLICSSIRSIYIWAILIRGQERTTSATLTVCRYQPFWGHKPLQNINKSYLHPTGTRGKNEKEEETERQLSSPQHPWECITHFTRKHTHRHAHTTQDISVCLLCCLKLIRHFGFQLLASFDNQTNGY